VTLKKIGITGTANNH